MAHSPFHLRNESIDEPLGEDPKHIDIDFTDSISSGYIPDPSPIRDEPMGEGPEVSPSKHVPLKDKGKGKVSKDTKKDQLLESLTPDAHFSQLDSYLGCNLPNATFVKLIGEVLKDFNFPSTHSVIVPTRRQRIYERPEHKEGGKETDTSWVEISRQCFKCGLHMPLNKFLITLINQIGMGIGQMAPNYFTTINTFLAQCINQDIDPTLKFF